MKLEKRPLRDDYSGTYIQFNGKMFECRNVRNYRTNTKMYSLIPLNFGQSSKSVSEYMMEVYLRNGSIRDYNPLEPSRKLHLPKHNFCLKEKLKEYF